jgi:predicted CXXCH cytochrome family protein
MRLAAAALASLALAWATAAHAGDKKLAPLPKEPGLTLHSPYEQGACDTCHERADAADPGAATATMATCLSCHDEFAGKAPVRIGKGKNHPIKGECVGCHNPHSSKKKNLLF